MGQNPVWRPRESEAYGKTCEVEHAPSPRLCERDQMWEWADCFQLKREPFVFPLPTVSPCDFQKLIGELLSRGWGDTWVWVVRKAPLSWALAPSREESEEEGEECAHKHTLQLQSVDSSSFCWAFLFVFFKRFSRVFKFVFNTPLTWS